MINHRYRCIFVHIPRTGGTSVQRFFGTHWQDHKDISRYAEELEPQTFASYYKFALVRNPWDRLVSDYNFQKMKKASQASRSLLIHDLLRRIRLDETRREEHREPPHRVVVAEVSRARQIPSRAHAVVPWREV